MVKMLEYVSETLCIKDKLLLIKDFGQKGTYSETSEERLLQ
jgi:hypothetical protein